jgi:hypothetical protein
MRLVEAETQFVPQAGTHYVRLAYETLTASYVAEKDEDIDFGLNGLQRVTRTFVALPDAPYTKVVGVDTITSGGDTLYLGNYSIKKTDAKWELTEVWLEGGVLSRSEDKVGSQLAIVIESLNDVPSTPSGYVLAKTDVSEVEGIPTNRYTFLKSSILRIDTSLTGGSQTVSATAFSMTTSEVTSEIAAVTANHKLIKEAVDDVEGIKTSTFTYEVDDFEVFNQTESGFDILDRTQLSTSNFTYGAIGTDTYSSLYLAQEMIDNGGTIKIRKSKWSDRGVISVRPVQGEEFSLAPSYTYTTLGVPASSMSGLVKPDGTELGSSVTWFEATVQNIEGFPTYTQTVLTATLSGGEVQVDSYEKFFVITDPGVMSTGGAFNSEETSGGAVRFPKALSQPQTFRKKATVDVFLTTSSAITGTEVAYTEEGVDWCSISFDSFYNNETDSSASVDASWRSFPQYLNSSGTTATAHASVSGAYFAQANSNGAGDETYVTTGVYRIELDKYQRQSDATQLYIRTEITFS